MINSLRVLAQRALVLAGLSIPLVAPSLSRAQQGGSLDTTFNPGAAAISSFTNTSVFSGSVTSLALQTDGSTIVGGNFASANGVNRGFLARVGANGAPDTAYNQGAGFNDIVRAVALQTNGSALVGGFFTSFSNPGGGGFVSRLARLNTDGTLDSSFNTSDGAGPNSSVRAIAVQTDGQVVIGGFFTTFSNGGGADPVLANRIARLNTADGTIDATFNSGAGADDSVESVVLQSDGKILIGGAFNNYNNAVRNRIARLNADGTLDPSFAAPFLNAPVRSMVIQTDGKIVVAGDFAVAIGATTSRGIVRLNANGSIDPTYAPGAGANNNVQRVTLLSSGQVLIGGDFTTFNGLGAVRVARLNTNGALDATFATGAGANATVRAFAVQASGNILVGGDFSTVNSQTEIGLARLTTAGAVDATFNTGGQGFGFTTTEVDALAFGQNKIYVGGNFSTINGNGRNNIDRLNSDGTPDAGFNPGNGTDGIIRAIAIDPFGDPSADGTLGAFVGGDFNAAGGFINPKVVRLLPNGSLDTSFGDGVQADGSVRALAATASGLIVGGDFTRFQGVARSGIVRIDLRSGLIDQSFNPTGSGADNSVRSISVQTDGQIIIGGDFRSFNGVSRNFFARLNAADGSLDTTFNAGVGADGSVEALQVQTDGRIIIGGAFSTVGGVAHRGVARLNADGTIDPSFVTSLNSTGSVDTLAIQPDGKVVIGGDFSTVGGLARANVARLNIDGTVDASFDPGTGTNSSVRALVVKNNGKTVIGGTFSTVNGVARARLAQLNGDTAPGTVQFTTDTYSASEAAGMVTLSVSRTGGSAGAVSVNYATADGSATAGSDYGATSGTLTWAAGDLTNKTITVSIFTDQIAEPTETFSVVLSAPNDDVNLGTPSRATVNILDNAPASLQFTQATYSGTEMSPYGSITVAVARVGNTVGAVSVDYSLAGITATPADGPFTPGADYLDTTGTLTWADGDGSPKTFVVTIFNDDVPESDETLQAILGNPQGSAVLGAPDTVILTIHDDDAAPILQFSAPTYTVSEGAGFAIVTATRSGSNVGQVSADYVSDGGTATANSDYTPVVGTLTWAAGDLSPKSFRVPIINDSVMEPDETVNITLGNPTGGAIIGPRSSTVLTITDDDMPSTVQFSAATYNSPTGSTQATLTVTRIGGAGSSVTVNYSTADGTAMAGVDYAPTSGTLTFGVGDATAKAITVPILNSSAEATPKTFTVALSAPSGTSLGTVAQATVTILGQATPVVTVVAKQPTVTEGEGRGKFVISRTGDTTADLIVRFTLKGGAQAGIDFPGVGKKVTIPAGKASVKVKIAPYNDNVAEGNEKVKLVLTATADYIVGSPAVASIVVIDVNGQE